MDDNPRELVVTARVLTPRVRRRLGRVSIFFTAGALLPARDCRPLRLRRSCRWKWIHCHLRLAHTLLRKLCGLRGLFPPTPTPTYMPPYTPPYIAPYIAPYTPTYTPTYPMCQTLVFPYIGDSFFLRNILLVFSNHATLPCFPTSHHSFRGLFLSHTHRFPSPHANTDPFFPNTSIQSLSVLVLF